MRQLIAKINQKALMSVKKFLMMRILQDVFILSLVTPNSTPGGDIAFLGLALR